MFEVSPAALEKTWNSVGAVSWTVANHAVSIVREEVASRAKSTIFDDLRERGWAGEFHLPCVHAKRPRGLSIAEAKAASLVACVLFGNVVEEAMAEEPEPLCAHGFHIDIVITVRWLRGRKWKRLLWQAPPAISVECVKLNDQSSSREARIEVPAVTLSRHFKAPLQLLSGFTANKDLAEFLNPVPSPGASNRASVDDLVNICLVKRLTASGYGGGPSVNSDLGSSL